MVWVRHTITAIDEANFLVFNSTKLFCLCRSDCSQRRCPSGDDPMTTDDDEIDCENIIAPGTVAYNIT